MTEFGPLTQHLDSTLETLYGEGCRRFYAGGAMGFDTLAASRVLILRKRYPDVRLYLLLPCRHQARGWPPQEVARYEDVLSRSDGFRYVFEEYSPTAMTARNHALVEAAEVCVAYVRRTASGSGQTVRAAEEKGIPVLNLANRF